MSERTEGWAVRSPPRDLATGGGPVGSGDGRGALRRLDRHDDRGVDGVVAGTDESARGPDQRAAGAARRRGLRRLRVLRLGDRHTHDRPARRRRPALHRLPHHGDVLDHPGRAAHRAEPPLGRDGLPGELRQRVPGISRQDRRRRADARRTAATPRLPQLPRRQVARDPADRDRADRAVRRLAARPWIRPVLRVPRRRDRSVLARTRARQHTRHRAG